MPASPSGRHTTVPPPEGGAPGTIVLEAPRWFGRYVIVGRIARGGMATVHLARQRSRGGFEKWVALKVVHPHLVDDEQFVQMFLNEARLVARLDHPNICTVFDFGLSDGTYFLAMEYLQGEPLLAVLRRGQAQAQRLPVHLCARVVADAARGLHAAHELAAEDGARADVVHRDVSPQNIVVLYNGATKVLDFGIARSREHLGEQTATGVVKGKVAYMAPEQIRGAAVDRRADVFALGVVLWEATTHQRLFKRVNDAATANAVLNEPIPPPSSVAPGYPEDLEHLVMCALARDPDERFQTADAMARALESYLSTCGAPASSVHVGDHMQKLFADHVAAMGAVLKRAADAARALGDGAPGSSDESYPSGAFRSPFPSMGPPGTPGLASGVRVSVPPVATSETAPAITLGSPQSGASASSSVPRGARWRGFALGALLASAAAGVALWMHARSDERVATARPAQPPTSARDASVFTNEPPPVTALQALAIPVGPPPVAVVAVDADTATAASPAPARLARDAPSRPRARAATARRATRAGSTPAPATSTAPSNGVDLIE